MKDPTRFGYQNLLNQVIGVLRCIGSLPSNEGEIIDILSSVCIIKQILIQYNLKDKISAYPNT
jgi:hypothetical protein